MSITKSFQVAGIDGCKAGWLVAIVSGMKRSSIGVGLFLRSACPERPVVSLSNQAEWAGI